MKLSYQKSTEDINSKEKLINELLDNEELTKFIKAGLTAIAELIENIYSHAGLNTSDFVEWSLDILVEEGVSTIVIADKGQGIPGSIRNKLKNNKMDANEAIKTAINGRFENGRGMGLLSIKNQVIQGRISSFIIESEKGIFRHDKNGEVSESSNNEFDGTRITLSIVAEGD